MGWVADPKPTQNEKTNQKKMFKNITLQKNNGLWVSGGDARKELGSSSSIRSCCTCCLFWSSHGQHELNDVKC